MNKYVITYIVALTLANLLVAAFGPWFSVVNSFALIGLDLSIRDKLHEQWQGKHLPLKMLALIVAAGLISYLFNTAAVEIALASVVAFCASMVADTVIYQVLRDKPWPVKSNGSNAAGALVDSIVFPTLAFGALLPAIVAMQFAAKMVGGALWSWVLRK